MQVSTTGRWKRAWGLYLALGGIALAGLLHGGCDPGGDSDDPVFVNMYLNPDSMTVAAGGNVNVTAFVQYSDGALVSQQVTWTSLNSTIASVSPGGMVTGVFNGLTYVRATLVSNPTISRTAAVNVTSTVPPLAITTAASPTAMAVGTVNQFLSVQILKTGGYDPVTWSVTGGTLPTGPTMALHAGTGVLYGTPTATGTFDFTVRVTDATGAQASKLVRVIINAAPSSSSGSGSGSSS